MNEKDIAKVLVTEEEIKEDADESGESSEEKE